MTPEEVAAQSAEIQRVLGELGVTPEAALMAEGRQTAMGRFGRAMERATELGQAPRISAIEARIERDAQTHARREMQRLRLTGGRPAPQTLGGAPVATSAPSPVSLSAPSPMSWMDSIGVEPAPETGLDPRAFPAAFDRPGYRPTSGIALGPQSQQEGHDLAAEQRGWNALMEVSGLAPLSRAGNALAEGDVIRGGAGIGEAAMMTALPFTRLGRAAFTTLPRGIGTGLGMGLVSETAHGRGPLASTPAEASDPVRALQQQLQDAGYYTGRIDGQMGPATLAAKAAFDAAQTSAATGEIERLQAQAAAAKAAADATQAQTAATESARAAADRAAGQTRLREIDDSPLSQGLNAAMSLGPWVGYGLGGVLGHRLQRALTGRAVTAAETRATAADDIMAQPVASTDVPGRVGRINRFWSEGHPSLAEPFRSATTRGRYPYTPNPNVPTAAELYQTPQLNRLLEATPVPVVGGVEHIATEWGLAGPARQELAAAQEAVRAEASEANIQRLQLARARMAASDLTSRLGLGMGIGSASHSTLHAIGGAPRARPASIGAAERERGLLTSVLGERPTPRGGGGPRRPSGGGGGDGGPVADPRLGGSGHRDPLTGRIARRP